MLNWLKRKTSSGSTHPLRETLFGDVELTQWAGTSLAEPWRSFAQAAALATHPDRAPAVRCLDGETQGLLAAGRELLARIGPWEGPRPPVPPGQARISLLTPSGLHFGQAAPRLLSGDGMAAPVLQAATKLMQALIARSAA